MISGKVVKKFVAATSVAVSAVLVTASVAPAAQADVESTSNRVLQSVSVAMSPDGTLTGVDGSLVETSGSAEDAEAQASSYAPSDVATDLPVRVLTAWRTSEGAGTDLSDLQGYSGRVAIDLTVQNLTVEPQMLQYDVDGTSRSQAALVGSPLTITASAGLGDLAPATIVTDDEDTGRNVTNGVIGRSADGTTVQWAAMLAPPTLSSSAELSLVVDAKNFDVPEFDLSVQPGLVTDPSIGALVDSAFNPGSSDELELQSRTISLIGEVNAVLARASGTISDVRSNLTSSAETLGTQTVADLQSSTESVTSNMRALDGALQGLQGDLSSTLESTGSSAVAELDQAVTAVDQMLGDTSAPVPTAQVDGNGCRTTVAPPKGSQSIYGNLLQVAGQLKGYAEATEFCKEQLSDSLATTIGDEETIDDCDPQAQTQSATCSLLGAKTSFTDIAEDLRGLADDAVELLNPDLYGQALDASQRLGTAVGQLETLTGLLDSGRLVTLQTLRDAKNLVRGDDPETPQDETGPLAREAAMIGAELDAIHTDAIALEGALDLEGMQTQGAEAAAQAATLCGAVLTPEQREALDATLVGLRGTDCDDADPTPDARDALVERLDADNYPQLQEIIESSDVEGGAAGAAAALSEIEDIRVDLDEGIQEALDLKRGNPPRTLEEISQALGTAFDELSIAKTDLDDAVEDLEQVSADVPEIEAEIDAAVDAAKAEIEAQLGRDIGGLATARDSADEELGTMFDRSREGLSNSADAVVRDGRRTLAGQKQDFARAQAEAGNRISSEIEGGLSQINQGVSASTRDMEAATALLTADLRKVLLDLGAREVDGGGLLGAMATNAATARTADYQLALATNATTAYANVRSRDIGGILLQQAQTDAALQMLADLPAFELDLPAGSVHRTVYSYRIGDGQ
ncbi:hypothetical protein [Nocardioides euryhalodurans]|uniref:Uncharacterized protein n=1 Tax=Nocardioides euryhalodurans TaxID=2518370 RepID=A0A4P7GM91_9ACTN|nr:hypothetical protein [Nocardioides euryhalodurans]QBR92887.1 hypothetical protein EXE57_11825 [Nocardioides euryhalodurans]